MRWPDEAKHQHKRVEPPLTPRNLRPHALEASTRDSNDEANPLPLPVDGYKRFLLCRANGATYPAAMLETLAVGWFGLGELPTLSLGRVNRWQLECALARRRDHTVRTELAQR
jgi:hypothetical protein